MDGGNFDGAHTICRRAPSVWSCLRQRPTEIEKPPTVASGGSSSPPTNSSQPEDFVLRCRFKVACCSGQGSEAGLSLPWPRTDDDMLMLCYGAFARSFRLVDEFRRLSWLGAVGKALGLKLCADMHGRSARAAGQSSRARHRYGRRLRSGDQPTQKSLEGLIDGRPSSCNT